MHTNLDLFSVLKTFSDNGKQVHRLLVLLSEKIVCEPSVKNEQQKEGHSVAWNQVSETVLM